MNLRELTTPALNDLMRDKLQEIAGIAKIIADRGGRMDTNRDQLSFYFKGNQ